MNLNLSTINILEEMAKNQTNKTDIECKFFESASGVPDPRDLSPKKKNLMVFDDLLLVVVVVVVEYLYSASRSASNALNIHC